MVMDKLLMNKQAKEKRNLYLETIRAHQ